MSNPCALPSLAIPPAEGDLKSLPRLEKKLARRVGEANAAYKLIADGDRILVAVSGGKAFIFGERAGDEVCSALDAATGKELWSYAAGKTIFDKSGGPGPRTTPTSSGSSG